MTESEKAAERKCNDEILKQLIPYIDELSGDSTPKLLMPDQVLMMEEETENETEKDWND